MEINQMENSDYLNSWYQHFYLQQEQKINAKSGKFY